jgi:hypothetical protein
MLPPLQMPHDGLLRNIGNITQRERRYARRHRENKCERKDQPCAIMMHSCFFVAG